MKTEIIITDESGNVQKYLFNDSLHNIIWSCFLTAQLQDEQWSDIDTCKLIIKTLTK